MIACCVLMLTIIIQSTMFYLYSYFFITEHITLPIQGLLFGKATIPQQLDVRCILEEDEISRCRCWCQITCLELAHLLERLSNCRMRYICLSNKRIVSFT